MRVLEIGNYIAVAYAGMVLAEQGHAVTKWVNGRDPTMSLRRGEELWAWINHGKALVRADIRSLPYDATLGQVDVVIDNVRAQTFDAMRIDPAALAAAHGLRWVSLRDDGGDRSFDVVAQARSWLEYGPWLPIYLGDTAAGLWLAFKALATRDLPVGHYVLYQASCLQKLVEGELVIDQARDGQSVPWDREEYCVRDGAARVHFKGADYVEPIRDRAWKLAHLHHQNGRIAI